MARRPGSRVRAKIRVIEDSSQAARSDYLATEEPLEVRLAAGAERKTIAVTMRTPGSDFELAVGFLFSEGILAAGEDVLSIRYCTDPDVDAEQQYNIVTVELNARSLPDLKSLERHFYTSSACGVCGKATLESLELRGCPVITGGPRVPAHLLYSLPDRLRAAQGVFESTGGLHAAGLFDAAGDLICVREDVGRHNAIDKLVGWALLAGRLPLHDCIVVVSGRASYEIMQKCLVAGVPIVCAVSAPSSLATSVAESFGMTLVGFLRGQRFNVYAGQERVVTESDVLTGPVVAEP
ncbi:MAG: formate dehydrogenase accessory sulfurtransferase FdhD [Actinobacteria bacterium]|nr:formate dehydrogenase accessory sulfurtransferase FdhD [Actinomycetota bacterium]